MLEWAIQMIAKGLRRAVDLGDAPSNLALKPNSGDHDVDRLLELPHKHEFIFMRLAAFEARLFVAGGNHIPTPLLPRLH